ncbi:MAG TPA: 2-phospho-L-lactate transferase CofD family protein, partial [Armatimonadota bacterium]|nr:2-phospho-L-lactate transferase CofD family protein [Armatimonadota bacterium]
TLLPNAVRTALCRSTGVKVYVCNVMTQPGETTGYTASDHVRALQKHGAGDCFDFVLVNTEPPPPDAAERYRRTGAGPVAADLDAIAKLGYIPVAAPLLNMDQFVRHDPRKLANALRWIWGGLADRASFPTQFASDRGEIRPPIAGEIEPPVAEAGARPAEPVIGVAMAGDSR